MASPFSSPLARQHISAGLADSAHPAADAAPLHTEIRHAVERLYGPRTLSLPVLEAGRAYRGASNAFQYGGDIIDVFQSSPASVSIVVVDIAGHGISAAPDAVLVKHSLRAYASAGFTPIAAVRALNRQCLANGFEHGPGFFAAVLYATLDVEREMLHYVSAGHEAAFVLESECCRQLDVTGPVVGLIDDDAAFQQATIDFGSGSIFAAVTDGFTEARNAERTFLGARAFANVIRAHHAFPVGEQADAATTLARTHTHGTLADDVAALVVRFAPPSGRGAPMRYDGPDMS